MRRTTTIVAILTLLAVACGKKEGGGEGVTESAAGGGTEAAGDDSIQQKLQPYIECFNRHSGRIDEVRAKYLEGVDPDKGPSPDKGPVMLGMYDIDQCVAGLAKAKEMKPPVPELEKAGDDYAAALEQLAPIAKEAYDYYQAGNWKDDKAAKGIELHPKLMAAFAAFDAANDAMSNQVKVLNRKAREEDLARREAKGKDLSTLTDRMMLEAQTLVEMTHVDPTKLETVDVPAMTAQIEKVEKQLGEVEAYAAANKEQANQLRGFSSVPGHARQFLTAAKELMRRARDKKPFSGSDADRLGTQGEWMVQGAPGQASYYYNQMVDAYNRM